MITVGEYTALFLPIIAGLGIVFAAVDILWQGAASQAVQNLNLMLGLPEDEGIGPTVSPVREAVR